MEHTTSSWQGTGASPPPSPLDPALGQLAQDICFFSLSPEQSLDVVLHRPQRFFIETTRQLPAETLNRLLAPRPHYAFSITSGTAYRSNPATRMVDFIKRRCRQSRAAFTGIETCLHEAIINAIAHGNFAVKRPAGDSQAFSDYWETVRQRTTDARFSQRMIDIMLWETAVYLTLAVRDEGCGFELLPLQPDTPAPYGRGHYLIRQMSQKAWMGEDGRTLYMRFNR
jgi:hypothetical protein